MSAFPNSHTTAFVKIPRQIEKTWTRGFMRGDTEVSRIPNPAKHRFSAIQSITLKVEYEPISAFLEKSIELNDSVESDDDQIRLWKENRIFWRDLEMAVEGAVTTYIRKVQQELTPEGERPSITFTAPCKQQVRIEHCESNSPPITRESSAEYVTSPSLVDFDDSRTVRPEDSVTVTDHQSLEEIIAKSTREAAANAVAQYKEVQKNRASTRTKGKNSRKSTGFAHSVANYIRT